VTAPEKSDTSESHKALVEAITAIRSDKGVIKDLPQDVHNWCGNLVKIVRTGGILSFASSLGTMTAVDEKVVIPKIWEYRDQINNALGETVRKLDEMDPDLDMPVRFLDYANEWKNVQGDIYHAANSFSETNLRGDWSGDAADRFWAMRQRQEPAFKAMSETCKTVADNLEEVAKAELELYSNLTTHTRELIEKVTGLVGNYLGSFFDLPFGPISSLGDVATAVESVNSFILTVSSDVAKSAFDNIQAANDIAQAESVQQGIPDNHWPPAVVAYPGSSPNDKQRITETIGDASTQDGDKSDWSIE